LNYGNHVGNDSIVSLLHEARVQFLQQLGYTELNIEGIGLIMADLAISYKKQLFYGDIIAIEIAIDNITETGFSLYYKILITNKENAIAALARTNMVCFDYALQKISKIPVLFLEKIPTLNN
jgi:YbgC/YbaW family acyl-CoA thioester hydrolase